MIYDLDTVVLKSDIKKHGLKKGDIGTAVHVYKNKKVAEVEFVDASGKTIALLTLATRDIRLMARDEILHARGFAAA